MASIHPSAIVDPAAKLADDVTVGPYCIVGPRVEIGAGTVLRSHVVVDGNTSIGRECTLWQFASIGGQTQDLKYEGGHPRVEIGDRNTFREYATVNAATFADGVTKIGNDNHIMAYCHVAHDCILGNGVIMANAATLAGHVIVDDQAIIGGLTGVHQFVRVGRMSITGGCSKIVKDVPPFTMADGNPLEIHGLNLVGLKRKKVEDEEIDALRYAYKVFYRENLSTRQALDRLEQESRLSGLVAEMASFIRASTRGITH